ncbi:Superfamily I DNA and RNA helicases [uncultured Clostridium sp.]|uniref:DEAD/DEAH box helicase n=1 Tax=uncultured Clostridium sp. TaxID=59620 RepID=UPI0008223C10|nr:ATP-binding domain-containing protein [uncultured Clostridium sp.]SCK02097.1 Superfamily I DNA and RNA helicases [uncultured Clostridium sp.]
MDSTSFFFSNIDSEYFNNISIKNLDKYANENFQNIYLINKPLSEKKYSYTVNKILIFLSPGYNINFVNLNLEEDEFDDIYEDFIEDLGHIADKYNYTDIISRPRKWKKFIKKNFIEDFSNETSSSENISSFLQENILESEIEKRTVKLLISLLTGSINSVEKIGKKAPESTLEKVKRNIILFDGDQTRFIFEEKYSEKVVKIQGLAGTGKTELLLHRLKEIYLASENSKIVFTCQSKTLANKLKARISEFFNFMKVTKQIEWNERIWAMHGWGSVKDIYNLGTYGMICRLYKLPFYSANSGSFAFACKRTLEHIKETKITIEPMFDYMLIDEGQDFTDDFIELCSMVTKNQVFVAGDIFQDIFGIQNVETQPNYLLNKCYRTDPRTLMFAHALGLALYENPVLRFLKDEEWKACGYTFEVKDGRYKLRREPVKRFDDIDPLKSPNSMEIIKYNNYNSMDIINIIKQIGINYPDIKSEDIAIVFPNEKLDYKKIDELECLLYDELKMKANILHNTKEIIEGRISISNKNNIKGLEFPFVICVADYIVTRDLPIRNTLYMTLTRSFIASYLLIREDGNSELINTLNKALIEINDSLTMDIPEPSEKERAEQESIIKQYNTSMLNQYEILSSIFDELGFNAKERQDYREAVTKFRANETNKESLKNFILTLKGIGNE